MDTELEFVSQEVVQGTLKLVYDQEITYKTTPDSGLQPADVVTQPFASQTSRDAFAAFLLQLGDLEFITIDSVLSVTQETVPATTTTTSPENTTTMTSKVLHLLL